MQNIRFLVISGGAIKQTKFRERIFGSKKLQTEGDKTDDESIRKFCNILLHRTKQVYDIVFGTLWTKGISSQFFVYAMMFHPEWLVLGQEKWDGINAKIEKIRDVVVEKKPDMEKYIEAMKCFRNTYIAKATPGHVVSDSKESDEEDMTELDLCWSNQDQSDSLNATVAVPKISSNIDNPPPESASHFAILSSILSTVNPFKSESAPAQPYDYSQDVSVGISDDEEEEEDDIRDSRRDEFNNGNDFVDWDVDLEHD